MKKKCSYLYGYKNLEWYSELKDGCDIKHIFISSAEIITFWVLHECI